MKDVELLNGNSKEFLKIAAVSGDALASGTMLAVLAAYQFGGVGLIVGVFAGVILTVWKAGVWFNILEV